MSISYSIRDMGKHSLAVERYLTTYLTRRIALPESKIWAKLGQGARWLVQVVASELITCTRDLAALRNCLFGGVQFVRLSDDKVQYFGRLV